MSALEPIQLERLREIGALLRREREAKGLSLEDVSSKTLIRPTILKAIEEADAKPLPEPVYLRGFIRRYGDLVNLPGVELSDSFPWEPSKVIPAAFVASGVTTAESVEETRRPVSLPRSEARVIEPDPVPLEQTNVEQTDVGDADSPVDIASVDATSPEQASAETEANAEFVNPYAAMPQGSLDDLTAEPAKPSASAPVPVAEPAASEEQSAMLQATTESSPPASPPTTAPSPTAAARIPEDPWKSEPAPIVSSPATDSNTAGSDATDYATKPLEEPLEEPPADSFTPLPVPQPPSHPEQSSETASGLPGAMIALILAAAALGISVAFALSNRGSEPVTQQTPEAAPLAESATPESPEPPATATNKPPTATEPASQPDTPLAVETPEVASQEASTQAPTAEAGEVSVALKLKEPAWFFVEVDGFVVFEGTTNAYSETVKGKEVIIGTSRPDLLLVSVDGNAAKPMGTEPGDKTETYKSGG